jgi:hypothetical protein
VRWTLKHEGGREIQGLDNLYKHFWSGSPPPNATNITYYDTIPFFAESLIQVLPLDSVNVFARGNWVFNMYFNDSIIPVPASEEKSIPFINYTYLRRAPILHAVSLPDTGDTSGWSFGTPRYLTVDWTPTVNTVSNGWNS